MKTNLRFVFDTNAVVSAVLLKKSVSRMVLEQAQIHGSLLISLDTLNELNDVLRREKFNRYITEDERLRFLTALVKDAIQINVVDKIVECRDPKDDKFLELAVSGQADYIVSGDKDLLVLSPFRDIPVMPPAQMLDILEKLITEE